MRETQAIATSFLCAAFVAFLGTMQGIGEPVKMLIALIVGTLLVVAAVNFVVLLVRQAAARRDHRRHS